MVPRGWSFSKSLTVFKKNHGKRPCKIFRLYFIIFLSPILNSKRTKWVYSIPTLSLKISTSFVFFKYIYWLCYYSCPISTPSLHSILPTPSIPHSPPIVHVHGSYIYVLRLLHFLYYSYPPPVYFLPTIYATYSLYLFPSLPLPLPYW